MKNRYICALTLILIIIIVGLHQLGVALFQYKGKKEGTFEATILSEPDKKEYVNVYKAKIEKKTFLLYIKEEKRKENSYEETKEEKRKVNSYEEAKKQMEIGTVIKIKAKLNEPKTRTNYKGFDYDLYLKSKGISGIFKVESYEIMQEFPATSQLFNSERNSQEVKNSELVNSKRNSQEIRNSLIFNSERFFQKIRNNIKSIYEKYLPKESSSLIEALTIGDKYLDEEVVENFRKASLSHILAISGAHFSYIILAITLMSNVMKRKRLSKILLIIITLFFIKLTGESPSVMRAGIMCIIGAIASLTKRKNDVLNSIAISLLIQIIINPYVIFDIGLILSYSGVLGIIYLYKIVYKYLKLKIISVTISANIILIPIMMYNFNTLSLSFIISNIFASILLGPIIIIGYIALIIRIKPLFFILNILIKLLSKTSQIVSILPFSNINIEPPSVLSLIAYYIIIYMVYKNFNMKYKKDATENKFEFSKIEKRAIAILLIIIVISNINFQTFTNNMYINFIDVSQGDACLIRQGKDVILIDGGRSK